MYQFLSRYNRFDLELRIEGDRVERCIFYNAIFETNDEKVAQALQHHRHFNVDFYLQPEALKVEDKYGDQDELGKKLEKLHRQKLISLCTQSKYPRKDAFRLTKVELIKVLLKNPTRTEALLDETERNKN